MILIKDNLKFFNYTNSIISTFKTLETCILNLSPSTNEMLYIISAYYPSGNNDTHLKSEIHSLFKSMNLQGTNNYYILAGGLNKLQIKF